MTTSEAVTTSTSDETDEVVVLSSSISVSSSSSITSSSPSSSTPPLSAYSLQWQRYGSLYILDCHPSSAVKIPGNRKVAAFDMVRFHYIIHPLPSAPVLHRLH